MLGERKKPYRYWLKEEKLKIINEVLNGKSSEEVARKHKIAGGMIRNWIRKYCDYGEESLENKRKPGNPLTKYSRRTELSELENLEYENMKLKIEVERLKKGYLMKGDGSVVVFKK